MSSLHKGIIMENCVVILLSGGIDSAVAALSLKTNNWNLHAPTALPRANGRASE
jgi:NH3-dependent NAD+ synthetase